VPGGRLAATVDHRLVLPLPERADYAVAGVPARAVPERRPPGRALLGEEALECQLALPGPFAPLPALDRVTVPGAAGPVRIVELAADPELPLPAGVARGPEPGRPAGLTLPVGPGGDEGSAVSIDLARTGGLLVAGPPGSGRSAALDAFAAHLHAAGLPVLRLGRGPGTTAASPVGQALDVAAVPGADEALAEWLAEHAGRPAAVLVDDIGPLAESPLLPRLPVPGAGTGPVPVVAGTAAELARCFTGPVAVLRRGRTGLLLCPGPGDADLLGIRLPRTPVAARPGSGWLVISGAATRVQVARRRIAVR
jgi:DNA segregation ATPase FtsK/SpoIIIE, S-DNA-T family